MINLLDIQKLYSVEMRKSKSISFFDIIKDDPYKRELFNVLIKGIDQRYHKDFLDILEYVVSKSDLFNITEIKTELYAGEDNIDDLILPSVRRVFGKVYTQPPPMFLSSTDDGLRLKMFQLSFDIDEFIDYFIDMIKTSKSVLSQFKYLDKTTQTLELIVDNYIAKLVKDVLETQDIKQDIAMLTRNRKIKGLIND
jgi:hypothetical protein